MIDIEKKAYEVYPDLDNTHFDTALQNSYNNSSRQGYIKACKEYESLPKIRGYVARDMDGALMFHISYPVREYGWFSSLNGRTAIHDDECYSKITWESDPVEVELLVRKV